MRLPPLPEPPRPPTRAPFPVIAVIAPIVGAVAIGFVVGSPMMLLFAILSPLIAIATVLDARRVARRHGRSEAQRFDRECALFEHAIEHAHAAERHPAGAQPSRLDTVSGPTGGGQLLRVGTTAGPSSIVTDIVRPLGDTPDDERLRGMLARAAVNPELPALITRGPLVLRGSGVAADVLARQWAIEPGVTLFRGDGERPVPLDATIVTVVSAEVLELREPGGSIRSIRPTFASREQLVALRRATAPTDSLPDQVAWGEVHDAPRHGSAHGVPIGLGSTGPVAIDLVGSGPHAIVGGTTGSGKSELLRALALGWAAERSPASAQLLFIDFKGGATFAGLTDLPHVLGLVTDLDPLVAQRALRALRAELRHRERVLADAGLRDVRDAPDVVPRLLVLVDEFAALVEAFPELHPVFADLAARGRSLGVHLVLCTQHPSGIVRDAIAANCPVRLSFRVTDPSSAALVGDLARQLVGVGPGRAALVDEHGARMVQVAVVSDNDIATVAGRWGDHPTPQGAWCDPLPEVVRSDDLAALCTAPEPAQPPMPPPTVARATVPAVAPAIAFGLLDEPENRRRALAEWQPHRDGPLAVIGASHSGRSMALAALATGLPETSAALVLPRSVPDAWAMLDAITASAHTASILFADDLDLIVAEAGDRAAELLARWNSAVRTLRANRGGAVASLSSSIVGGGGLLSRFESRLVLRCADADEHSMSSAPRGLFDRGAPPGRGWWRDLQVQVTLAARPLPAADPLPVREWIPDPGRDVFIVAARVPEVISRLAGSASVHRTTIDPSECEVSSIDPTGSIALEPRVVIGTPDTWQSAWGVLTAAKQHYPLVLAGVTEADVRAVLGHREPLPPIDRQLGDVWLVEPGGQLGRVRWQALRVP